MEKSKMIEKICKQCSSKIHYAKGLCYKCYMKDFNTKNYKKNKEKIKEQTTKYYYDNIEVGRKKRRVYAREHNRLDYMNEYYAIHKIAVRKKQKEYYEENKTKILKHQYEYKKHKLANDLNFYLKERLSTRIRMAIMNHKGIKKSSSIKLLGASIDVVREHLESLFIKNMSWENRDKWHIDYIIPCDSFDLTKEEEQLKCFNYNNLQPLWICDNILKSNKIQ